MSEARANSWAKSHSAPLLIRVQLSLNAAEYPWPPLQNQTVHSTETPSLRQMLYHCGEAGHTIDSNSPRKSYLVQKEASACPSPSSLALIIGKERDCKWISLIIIYLNKQTSLLPLHFPSFKSFTPSITLIRLIKPLAGADMSLGEHVSKARSMDYIKGLEPHINQPGSCPQR